MLWLIQRDFLGGASPQAALDAALSKVKNPGHDAGISAVNKVRSSLRRIAPRSTAFGLPQPHLDRTKLCELGDEALAPAYREKRAELRELVRNHHESTRSIHDPLVMVISQQLEIQPGQIQFRHLQ